MDSLLSIITLTVYCLCLLHPFPTECRLQRDPCFPCTGPHQTRLHPLNVSTHLNRFIETLQQTADSMSDTLEQVTRPHPFGCDLEMNDEEYPDVNLPHHCFGNRLTDSLKLAYRVLSEAASNVTMANDVIAGLELRRFPGHLYTHLKTPLCYLWKTLASLGHYPTCATCTTQLPPEVNLRQGYRCNFAFITYRRAIRVAESVVTLLQRPLVQSDIRQCYSNAM